MIECKAYKKIGERVILDVDSAFEEGKIYAVIGNNGSGKSTLLNVLSHQIKFEGRISGVKDFLYMPQSVYNFDFSVRRNVLLFVGKKDIERRDLAEKMMDKIGLSPLAKKNAKTLSGGESQKTALCRILLRDCSLLLLDEPTSSMDESAALVAEELIKQYAQKTGCSVFIVTHSVSQAERIADEILFLSDGKITESGRNIIKKPNTPELKAYLNNL